MRRVVPMIGDGTSDTPRQPDLPDGVGFSIIEWHEDGTVTIEVDESFLNPARDLAAKLSIMDHLDELTEDDVMSASLLFEPWEPHKTYKAEDVRRWDGTLIKCLQDHTNSDPNHTPDLTPALWKVYRDPDAGPQPWVQPQGAHDAYNAGEQVTHNGQTWQSTVDTNTWEPGVYGWEVIE